MILKRVLVGSFLAGGVFVANIFMGVHSAWADGSGMGSETGGGR